MKTRKLLVKHELQIVLMICAIIKLKIQYHNSMQMQILCGLLTNSPEKGAKPREGVKENYCHAADQQHKMIEHNKPAAPQICGGNGGGLADHNIYSGNSDSLSNNQIKHHLTIWRRNNVLGN